MLICHFKNLLIGAVDGPHIEILAPLSESKRDYFSRKQKCSINSQAAVGSNLMFLDVLTGFPSSVHDAILLRASTLYQKCEANELLTRPEKIIEEMRVRPLLLGDGAFPSTMWLVKPYPSNIRKNLISLYPVQK